MPTQTTHFDLQKPLVNSATDQDLWGGFLNDDLDTIDSELWIAQRWITRSISSTDTLTTADERKLILASASGGAVTVNLPAAATAGDGFVVAVKRTNSGANAVTIDGNSSETIDGSATYVLSNQYHGVILQCDGSNWNILAVSCKAPVVTTTDTQTLTNKTLTSPTLNTPTIASPAFTGFSSGTIVSGTYSPTLTNTTNISASSAVTDFNFVRTSGGLTVSGMVNIDPTTSGAACELAISLPVASNLTNTGQCVGVGSIATTSTETAAGGIIGDTSNDRAIFRFLAPGTAQRQYCLQFTYIIQ